MVCKIPVDSARNAPESHERRIDIFHGYCRADSIFISLSAAPATKTGREQYAESDAFNCMILHRKIHTTRRLFYVELQSKQESESSLSVACLGPSSDGRSLTC